MTELQPTLSVPDIIAKNEETLAPAYQARESLQADEVAATNELGRANKALKRAQNTVARATKKLQGLEAKDYTADHDIEIQARSIAMTTVTDESLDPLSQTLYSLIYNDRGLAFRDSEDSYGSAAYKARQAIDTILEYTQPGAPIIGISRDYGGYSSDDYVNVYAGVANTKTLRVTVPKLKTTSYRRLEGGAIELVLPKAMKATSKDQGLASLDKSEEHRIELIKNHWEYDYERLELLAKNDGQVVIGTEAISKRLETMNQGHRVAAMLALRAVGVVIPVPEETTEKLQTTLVVAVAELASGRKPSEYEHKGAVLREDIEYKRFGRRKINTTRRKEDSLLVVAQSLSINSLRWLLVAAELNKDSLTDRVAKTLESSKKDNESSIEALAQNARTLATLDGFIDTIYSSEIKSVPVRSTS